MLPLSTTIISKSVSGKTDFFIVFMILEILFPSFKAGSTTENL
jgi:hypothetical protein